MFSFRSREEIEALEKATENEPHKRLAQKALADDVTDIVHGSGERQAVVAAARPSSDAGSCPACRRRPSGESCVN